MRVAEFRSDTMTLPTEAMRDAMRDAELGDDVCGEDPTVNRLQAQAAALLGKEAALFVPSGTFGNQCAIAVQTRPGDEIIVGEPTHVIDHEAGAAGALAGVQTRVIEPRERTYPTAAEIVERIRTIEDDHHPDTTLIILENSLTDGTVMPLDELSAVRRLADRHHIRIHLDGARLFNAALALGVDAAEIAAHADTVMICLSKGLGAPVGSLLLGTEDLIYRARRRRKLMGGGMRQVGVLAAAGILALEQGPQQLPTDHANARRLAEQLAPLPGIELDLGSVQTNMVFCQLKRPGKTMQGLVDHLATRGLITYPPGWWGLRFVTSSRVTADDVDAVAAAAAEYLEG
jgi:threonine aldolase